jgi:hypothetical protein
MADQDGAVGQNPHDWDDNRILLAARNETRALRLTPAVRVNSGTDRLCWAVRLNEHH